MVHQARRLVWRCRGRFFSLRQVENERDWFSYCIAILGQDQLIQVADLLKICPPPPPDAYGHLKQRLVSTHILDEYQRLESLHELPHPGGQRPSELLAKMRQFCLMVNIAGRRLVSTSTGEELRHRPSSLSDSAVPPLRRPPPGTIHFFFTADNAVSHRGRRRQVWSSSPRHPGGVRGSSQPLPAVSRRKTKLFTPCDAELQ